MNKYYLDIYTYLLLILYLLYKMCFSETALTVKLLTLCESYYNKNRWKMGILSNLPPRHNLFQISMSLYYDQMV